MKKLFFVLSLFMAVSMTFGQNTKAIENKLKAFEKSKSTIADPAKASDPDALIAHANLLVDMNGLYTMGIYQDMDMVFTPNLIGRPIGPTEEVTYGEITYKKYPFPKFDLYVNGDNKIVFWVYKQEVHPGALKESYDMLQKAKDLEARAFVAAGRGAIAAGRLKEEYKTLAFAAFYRNMYKESADNFIEAAKCDEMIGVFDTTSYYYAGVFYNMGGELELAKENIQKVIDAGYSKGGDAECILADILTSMNRPEEAITLLEGALKKYPTNTEILFKSINAFMKANKDPHMIIETLKLAQNTDSTNVSLYLVEANLHKQLNDTAQFVECLNKALELDPKCLNSFYGLADLEISAANECGALADKMPLNDQKGYEAKMQERFQHLRKAVEYYEKALEVTPDDVELVTSIRQLYYNLRQSNDEKVEEKYKYYKEMEEKMLSAGEQPQQ